MNFYNVRRALEYIITLYTLAGMIKTRFGLVILLSFLLVGQKYLNLMPDNSIVLSKESFKFYQTCPYTKPYAFNRFS